jgi:hypothetical protein
MSGLLVKTALLTIAQLSNSIIAGTVLLLVSQKSGFRNKNTSTHRRACNYSKESGKVTFVSAISHQIYLYS